MNKIFKPFGFTRIFFLAILCYSLLSTDLLKAQTPTAATVPETTASSASNTFVVNCDMVQCPNYGNGALKAIVWDEGSPIFDAYLFVEFNGTPLTISPITIPGGVQPDVVIGDDMNNPGQKYIIAVVYENSSQDVVIETFLVDLTVVPPTPYVTAIPGGSSILSTSSKFAHIDLFPDKNPANNIGSLPAMHKYIAAWYVAFGPIQYSIGDIGAPAPGTPTTVTSASGSNPDVAAYIDVSGDEIACIVYNDNTGLANVREDNLTTPALPVITSLGSVGNSIGNCRMEAFGFYNGTNPKWQVVGNDINGDAYGYNDLNSGNYSSGLSMTGPHLQPVVAAGLGTTAPYIGNTQYTTGWYRYFTSSSDIIATSIDLTGNQVTNWYYVNTSSNPVGPFTAFSLSGRFAISSSSNSGNGLLSAWFDGSDIMYKETSIGLSPVFGFKPTNITSVDKEITSALYPNPATDMLTITGAENAAYTIGNITGIELQKGKIRSENETLDITGLPAGIYTIRFIGNRSFETLKFVKE